MVQFYDQRTRAKTRIMQIINSNDVVDKTYIYTDIDRTYGFGRTLVNKVLKNYEEEGMITVSQTTVQRKK